ncbi:crustacyanin-A2 subunit-like [Penaeus japonicus]|uniref:crustacyanin-A2 subunit-like n=1 Tax=Penaeus japonicus TaxID=27405 RepID=UPI001C7125B3|nr:crustacyanin-A2 subunit-like [Penaeus japonicus]
MDAIVRLLVPLAVLAGGFGAAVPITPDLAYIRNGTCLNVRPQASLNYGQFAGRWVEVSSRPNEFRQARQCVNMHFIITEDTPLRITTGINTDHEMTEVVTRMRPQETQSSFIIELHGLETGTFDVLDTDYDNLACVYQCQQATPNAKVEWAYVYARNLKQSEEAEKRCRKVFLSRGFDVESLVRSPHPDETCNTAI